MLIFDKCSKLAKAKKIVPNGDKHGIWICERVCDPFKTAQKFAVIRILIAERLVDGFKRS